MAVDSEMLKRIMGMPDSVTGKLVAMRRTPTEAPLETGVWYSNFTRVKTEAERRGIPFIAMWTNGDLCGFCRRFTDNILHPAFIKWMQVSGNLFWLGGSMDDNEEDKRGGIGFNWCRGPEQKVSYFPFVSVVHYTNGRYAYRKHASGNDYDGGKGRPEGAPRTLISILNIVNPDRHIQLPEEVKAILPDEDKGIKLETAPEKTDTAKKKSDGRLSIRFNSSWDADHISRFQLSINEHGGYCPCRADRNADTKCMCREFLDQKLPCKCRCGVFEKYYA